MDTKFVLVLNWNYCYPELERFVEDPLTEGR